MHPAGTGIIHAAAYTGKYARDHGSSGARPNAEVTDTDATRLTNGFAER